MNLDTTTTTELSSQVLVVLCNVPELQLAEQIAHRLLELRLAACVNIISGLRSVYRWEHAVHVDHEVQLQIKTVASRYLDLQHCLQAMHSYALPEIIALPVQHGLPDYLAWVVEETQPL